MNINVNCTRLHDWHLARGANMANFGGYEMPLWYPTGIKEEHRRVLTNAGLFDTSHMAAVLLRGPDARRLIQYCFTKDLSSCIGKKRTPLVSGRCVYGAFLDSAGYVIDDAIIYQFDDENYIIIVNAGMGKTITDHLAEQGSASDVALTDLTDNLGKMDIQGPLSAKIIKKILMDPEGVLSSMPYFSFKGHFDGNENPLDKVLLKDSTPILLSRTGYTGEFGFEIFVKPEMTVSLWQSLLKAGEEFGLIPCALAARDSLRTGARLPLSHQDIGHWPFMNHPWSFALPLESDTHTFTKEFLGRKALENIKDQEYTLPFAGYDLRKISVADPAVVIDPEGNTLGTVLTCVTDMAIGRVGDRILSINSPERPNDFDPKGLSCGFLKIDTALPFGTEVYLQDSRRKIKVQIVEDIRPARTARVPLKDML